MRNTTLLLAGTAAAALGWSGPALAQDVDAGDDEYFDENVILPTGRIYADQILVTASRSQTVRPRNATGSVTLITRQQLEERQTRDIADLLRDVPGVVIGSVPGQTQIRLRGSEANHTLVLVDGIEASDPGSGELDLGTLQAEIGSFVEVLRGPQSALYGSDAIAGVVAYRTGQFEGIAARLEGGTNNTINGAARAGFVEGDVFGSLSATVVSTDGEPNARGGTRDIGRDSYTVSGKLNARVAEGVELRAVGRYVQTEGDSNDQDFTFGSPTRGFVIDSPGVGFENEILSGLIGANFETLGGDWTHDLSLQFTDANRQNFAPFGISSNTESDRFKASYVSGINVAEGHSLTFAADYELEGFNNVATFDDRKEAENVGLVAEYRYAGERFDIAAALRHDINDLFQDATTFRIGAGFDATDTTRIRAAVGTGVKNPTLSELFGFFDGVFVGNPDLQPEESTSWEIGIDQSFADGAALLSITYFNAELDNEIFTAFGPPPTFIATPLNRDTQSDREGVEVALRAQFNESWALDAAYTYLDAEENGVTEVRRPESTASAALTWTAPRDRGSATLVVRHNGSMLDSDFTTGASPTPVTTLDAFTLVNLNARYQIATGLELFARAENLLDEDYEQVFTFVAPGRQVIAGFRAEF